MTYMVDCVMSMGPFNRGVTNSPNLSRLKQETVPNRSINVTRICSIRKMRTCLHYPLRIWGFAALLVFWFPFDTLSDTLVDYVETGFSASASDGIFLHSLNTTFSASFHNISEMVYLCVMHTASRQIVWTANRDHPASMSDSLSFTQDGISILMHGNSSNMIWSLDLPEKNAKTMQMRETGNLVLLDASMKILWQSFDYPTDTLLTGQVLKTQASMNLVSSISDANISSGPFSLSLKSGDLYLVFSPTSGSPVPYWLMKNDARLVTVGTGAPTYMLLNSTSLNLMNNNSQVVSSLTWNSDASLCRATLGTDGNLGIYAFSSNNWTLVFLSIIDACNLPLICGALGVCSAERCSCPDSLQPLNDNISHGCQRPSLAPCAGNSSVIPYFQKIGDGLDYFANKYITPQKTTGLDACKTLCSQNCSCSSFFFYNESGYCYLFSEIGSIQASSKAGHTLYFRATGPPVSVSPAHKSHSYDRRIIAAIGGASFIIVLVVVVFYCRKMCMVAPNYSAEEENMHIPGLPTRFSYKDLHNATKNFSVKLGSGAFGTVYEGYFPDNTRVAVKRLERGGHGKAQFQAEVATIGSIRHVNLVHLHGFCLEGAHRLLVYEYMANGSLDKFLFPTGHYDSFLDWTTRYSVALGTARGLAYLHHDCRERIIHCDIKPENILLDERYNVKVSDFGLAKLLAKEENEVLTSLRGTRGYVAPEWLMSLPVSAKSDVYSFGMVLLEIISGRRNYVPVDGISSSMSYFPAYAFEQSGLGRFDQLVDERLARNTVRHEQLVRMVKIAFLCIQKEVLARPSMANVVKMLEGSVDVTLPPLSQQHYQMMHESDLHFNQLTNSENGDKNSLPLLSGVIELSAATHH